MSFSEEKSWTKSLSQNPSKFIEEGLGDLHRTLSISSEDPLALEALQMKKFSYSFDLFSWEQALPNTGQTNASLPQAEISLRNYLFHSWLKERYLGLIQRTVRSYELRALNQMGAQKISPALALRPAWPTLVRISPFHCKSKAEENIYLCHQNHFLFTLRLSQDLFCHKFQNSKYGLMHVLVRQSPQGLKIVDVLAGHEKIFQSSLNDFNKLNKLYNLEQLKDLLLKWSFTSAEFLYQERPELAGKKESGSRRLPASNGSR